MEGPGPSLTLLVYAQVSPRSQTLQCQSNLSIESHGVLEPFVSSEHLLYS